MDLHVALLVFLFLLNLTLGDETCEDHAQNCSECSAAAVGCVYQFLDGEPSCISKTNEEEQRRNVSESDIYVRIGGSNFCSYATEMEAQFDHLAITKANETEFEDGEEVATTVPSLPCNSFMDFWTLLGGFFLGVAMTIVAQVCFGVYRARKNAAYNEPFRFDSFVNQ